MKMPAITMPVATSSSKVKTETCTVGKSETARETSATLGTIRAKAILKVEERAKPTKNVLVVNALATARNIAKCANVHC